jgi:hypothetical protein
MHSHCGSPTGMVTKGLGTEAASLAAGAGGGAGGAGGGGGSARKFASGSRAAAAKRWAGEWARHVAGSWADKPSALEQAASQESVTR